MAKSETFEEDLLETYANLSPAALRLIDFLRTHPEGMSPLDFSQPGMKVPPPRYPLQPWPTLVGGEKLGEIQRATLGITELIQTIPERIFDNDLQRMGEYYGVMDPVPVASIPRPPNGLDKSLARGDFIDTEEGLRCVEVNMMANVGGLELGLWESACRQHPAVAEFLDQGTVEPRFRNPLEGMFSQILREALQSPLTADGDVHVVMAVKPHGDALAAMFEPPLKRLFAHLLGQLEPGATGEFRIIHDLATLSAQSERLYHGGRRVHSFINYSDRVFLSDEVHRCFEAGHLILYNTPLANLLSHKASLALLSEHSESDLFDAEEQSILRDHVPWCRKVGPQTVSYRGEQWRLPELLAKRREHFVLKESKGARGEEVFVGRYSTAQEWQHRVADALRRGIWVAQEFLTSRPHLFPSGEGGCSIHDVVWGFFCFGRRYGGGFLRTIPREDADGAAGMAAARGVVNSKRGATEGLMFEV